MLAETESAADVPPMNDMRPPGLIRVAISGTTLLTRCHAPETRSEVRELLATTGLPYRVIAERTGMSLSSVAAFKKKEGIRRPAEAARAPFAGPPAAPAPLRARLTGRIYRALARQLATIELRSEDADAIEKNARALSVLAKTLETLTALGRDDEGRTKEPEPQDRADVTARLAERIARWAEGRTGPA